MLHRHLLRLLALAPSVALGLVALPAWGQSAASPSGAIDPSTSPADRSTTGLGEDDAPHRFDGRGVWVGAGPGVIVGEGEASFATRIQLAFPVADWFAVEGGLLGQSFSMTDHHGDRVQVDAGAITAGARFSLPPDLPARPYAAARVVHLHYFPDPFAQHGHDAAGTADHESHHRWGAGGAIGLDAGIPEPSSRFRLGLEAEVVALTGEGANVMGQVVALFGVGF